MSQNVINCPDKIALRVQLSQLDLVSHQKQHFRDKHKKAIVRSILFIQPEFRLFLKSVLDIECRFYSPRPAERQKENDLKWRWVPWILILWPHPTYPHPFYGIHNINQIWHSNLECHISFDIVDITPDIHHIHVWHTCWLFLCLCCVLSPPHPLLLWPLL